MHAGGCGAERKSGVRYPPFEAAQGLRDPALENAGVGVGLLDSAVEFLSLPLQPFRFGKLIDHASSAHPGHSLEPPAGHNLGHNAGNKEPSKSDERQPNCSERQPIGQKEPPTTSPAAIH